MLACKRKNWNGKSSSTPTREWRTDNFVFRAGYLEKEDGLGYETPQGLIYNLTKEREEARLAMDQITLVKSELENRDKLIRELESHVSVVYVGL